MWIIIIAVILVIAFLLWYFYYNRAVGPTITLVQNTKTIKIKWEPVAGAQSYTVHVGKVSKNYDKTFPTTNTEYEIPKEACRKYFVAVKSVVGTCTSGFSNEAFTETVLTAPSIESITKKGEKLFIKYSVVPGAQGYIAKVGLSEGDYRWTGRSYNTSFVEVVIPDQGCIDLFVKVQAQAQDCEGVLSETKIYKQSSGPTTITGIDANQKISWSAKEGAKQYTLLQKKGTGQFVELSKTSTTSFDLKEIDCGIEYEYMVQTEYEGCTAASAILKYTSTPPKAPSGLVLQ